MPNEGIELEVYSYTDPFVKLDTINGRMVPQFLEELSSGGIGGGSFDISITEPKLLTNPLLISGRSIIKVLVNNKVVGAYQINIRKSDLIGEGERTAEVYHIAGSGLKAWFEDAEVRPYGGLQAASRDNRYFSWASERGSWYHDEDWVVPFDYGDVFHVDPWGDWPKKWPVNATARWVWGEPKSAAATLGNCFFRYEFSTDRTQTHVIYAVCDDHLVIYMDGEQLLVNENGPAFYDANRVEVVLPAGDHVLAIQGWNNAFDVGPAAMAAALYTIVDDKEVAISYTGQAGWLVSAYPEVTPAWTGAEVLLTLLYEAGTRGVLFPSYITPTFTETHDSNGQPWQDKMAWSFGVGEPLSSVISKLEEVVCDIWIDPENYNLNMVIERGVDRTGFGYGPDGITVVSTPVEFKRGKNLRVASTESHAKIKNSLSVKSNDGWFVQAEVETGSQNKYGVLEGTINTGAAADVSEALAGLIFAQKANEEEGASYDVFPTDKTPFVDFNVGDWVLAPNEQFLQVKRRVMSISLAESESGQPLYTIEFDTIFHQAEERLGKMLSNQGVGGSFNNAGGNSPIAGPVIINPTLPPILTPMIPTVVAISSVGEWTPNGMEAFSRATVSWAPVTSNTDGSETVVPYYQVWGYKTDVGPQSAMLWARVTSTSAKIEPLQPGTNWTFKVLAESMAGATSAFSNTASATLVGPIVPMDPPAKPVLVSSKGLLIVSWTGLLDMGQAPPPQFRYVYAMVSTTSGGTYTRMGSSIQRDGRSITIAGLTVGQTYFVKLFGVDGSNITSAGSAISSLKVVGIDLGSLEADVAEAIAAAKQAGIDARAVADGAAISAGNAAQTADDALEAADDAANDAQLALDQVLGSITNSLDEYVVTNSSSTAPGPGAAWSADTPDWEPGQYVWRRTKNTRLDGSVQYSSPAVITGASGETGEDAVLLRVSSTRGTSFKNNAISTVLTVTVYKGSLRITDITALHTEFGLGAFLEWWWRRIDDAAFQVVSSADDRLSQAGFALTVSPADVDEQSVFECRLQTPN